MPALKKPRRCSAQVEEKQKLCEKQDCVARCKQQAGSTFAHPKYVLQAGTVHGSSPLAAPFKITDKHVSRTAYFGLRDPKPKPTPAVDPTSESGREFVSDDSAREFHSGFECKLDIRGEPTDPACEACARTTEEMLEKHGFGCMQWDGKTPRSITDGSGHIVANLIGCPGNPSWEGIHQRATELLREVGGHIHCSAKASHHWHSNFKALAQSICYGTGMTVRGPFSPIPSFELITRYRNQGT